MVGCFSFIVSGNVFPCLYLLGGTTYRGPNYSLPFSWSCQSSTHDNRCHPVSSDPLTDLSTQTLGKAGAGKIQKMSIQESICSSPFTMSWDIWTSNKTCERHRRWNGLTFPMSLTFPKSQQPEPSLSQIQCGWLELDSAQPFQHKWDTSSPISILAQSSTLLVGPEELWCPILPPRISGPEPLFASVLLIRKAMASTTGYSDFPVDSFLEELLGHATVLTSCLPSLFFFFPSNLLDILKLKWSIFIPTHHLESLCKDEIFFNSKLPHLCHDWCHLLSSSAPYSSQPINKALLPAHMHTCLPFYQRICPDRISLTPLKFYSMTISELLKAFNSISIRWRTNQPRHQQDILNLKPSAKSAFINHFSSSSCLAWLGLMV